MNICVRGYKPLVIPNELAAKEVGPFDGHTPYVAKLTTRLKRPGYLERKLPSKLLALEALKGRMITLGGYKTFSEPLAGVGLSARLFEQEDTQFFLNDTDEGCRKILKLNFGGKPTGHDALTMELPKADAIFLDFNDFTFKRYLTGPYKTVLERAFSASKKFVILNDCSVFYFRYGKFSFETYSGLFGKPINSVTGYFQALSAFLRKTYKDWRLIHIAYFRDTAFLLFSRNVASLNIELIEPEPIVSVLPEML